MKQYALIILAIITSTSAVAQVTDADVAQDTAWAASQNPSVPQSQIDFQWNKYNKPPNEIEKKSQWISVFSGNSWNPRLSRSVTGYKEVLVMSRADTGQQGSVVIPIINGRTPSGKWGIPVVGHGDANDYIHFTFNGDSSLNVLDHKYAGAITQVYVR